MCCSLLVLVFFGPRVLGVLWWLFDIPRWQVAFQNWVGPGWIWPILGILFLPWTTLFYMIVAGGGVSGVEWLWLAVGVIFDAASAGGGFFRKRIPQYQGA